ncbi:hypothetical protein JCM3765_006082 [Sporobolomyces pararoseus]
MSTDLKESSEAQSTSSVPNERDSQSNAPEEPHDLDTSLNLLALSPKAQRVVSAFRRSCPYTNKGQVSPRNSDPDNFKPSTLDYLSSTISDDPRKHADGFAKSTGLCYLVGTAVFNKFRQSNCYPPLGTSIDLGSFNSTSFAKELERFLHEKGGDEEDKDHDEAQLDQVPDGRWIIFCCLSYVVFTETLMSPDTNKAVYAYWEKFVWKMSKSAQASSSV